MLTIGSEDPTNENERQAATLKVGISNYVGSATLAVIAGAAALYTFILQNNRPRWYFFAAVAGALACLVLSVVLGGRGANNVAEAVGMGTWKAQSKTLQFEWQATLTLAGLVLVIVAAFLGNASPTKSPNITKPASRQCGSSGEQTRCRGADTHRHRH